MRLQNLYPVKGIADVEIDASGSVHGITLIFSDAQAASAFVAAIASFTENQVQLKVVNGKVRSTEAIKQVYLVRTTAEQEAIILAKQLGSTPAAGTVQEKVSRKIDTLSQVAQESTITLEEGDSVSAATGSVSQTSATVAYGLLGIVASPTPPIDENTPILHRQRTISVFSDVNRPPQASRSTEQENCCARCNIL
ncbi:MAG: hypothetical protein K0S08_1512 [Gammaproteobacteria bacterium]|jgi:hypothetical protein|nr:hypothetical protein [Gammaproteobacteria bacterium]